MDPDVDGVFVSAADGVTFRQVDPKFFLLV